ncbi:MAG: NACHT domain-containing NTPase [Coleofasciculus sp. C3-bin4]|nr:NACHT domain-containing NTPase [Coleofasciculus sp. C3-bin4]
MPRQGLQASVEGIRQAIKAFHRIGLTQQQLADEIPCGRQTIGNFFKGRRVRRQIFREICFRLELDWEEIAAPEPVEEPKISTDIDALVQDIREKVRPSIQQRCGTMRVLDMTQPIGLDDIYTNVNVLERITGRMRLEIAQLLQGFDPQLENFDHIGLGRITGERVPGLKAVRRYPKLMVLGKPGSGKTTFLKYLAIHCSSGNFLGNLVPIFITLRDFAEANNQPSCLEFIVQILSNSGVTASLVTELIQQGKALILLDGLDEVREEYASRAIKEIREFSEQYHSNQFVITCRIAAREYTFEKFTEVEVADFNHQQIRMFATKWFQAKDLDLDLAERFMQQLQSNPPIKELATNPLLLTLLCLEFEDSGDFPADRAELYKRAIATLLIKWDAKRDIERSQVYKKLSVQRKQDLLSQIALTTFEGKDYFFKQRDVERYIADYIRNLPNAQTHPEALQVDSEVVLKSIEGQHGLLVERARGIYSFSHLTFQEYFAARKIVTSSDPQALERALQCLVSHITDKSWREVFLLAVGMLPPADYLLQLMKQQVDLLVATDEKIQQFLRWVSEKSSAVEVPYKPAAVRAFYFNLDRDHHPRRDLACHRNSDIINILDRRLYLLLRLGDVRTLDLGLDDLLALAFDRSLKLDLAHSLYAFKGAFFLACERALKLAPELGQALQQLKNQLPEAANQEWRFRHRWEGLSQIWTEQLRAVMIKYRNIGHDWQFSDQQKDVLGQYYNANQLLVECLNSDCYVSREVRSHIEDTLLLPTAEIERRSHSDRLYEISSQSHG